MIYDTYIRHDFKFLNLNRFKCAISFFRLYYIAKCKIDFIEKINNYYKPKKIIISSKGFISRQDVWHLGIFQSNKKKPIFFADNSYKIYKKNEYLYSFHNITKDDLKKSESK